MMEIKNIQKIFICALMIGFNVDFFRANYPKIMRPKATYFLPNIFNDQFMIGILLLISGIISSN